MLLKCLTFSLSCPPSPHTYLHTQRLNIYLVANATLFDFLFHRFVMIRVHFAYSIFAWRLHGDVDLRWSGGLFDLELH